jgi:putative oxidoreductase
MFRYLRVDVLGGALALILGWRAQQAALGLILFIIPATLLFHAFWSADTANYQNQLNHFLKNLAIMGGMLYMMVFGPGALSLDERADRS